MGRSICLAAEGKPPVFGRLLRKVLALGCFAVQSDTDVFDLHRVTQVVPAKSDMAICHQINEYSVLSQPRIRVPDEEPSASDIKLLCPVFACQFYECHGLANLSYARVNLGSIRRLCRLCRGTDADFSARIGLS
jgi:hypothetical protein